MAPTRPAPAAGDPAAPAPPAPAAPLPPAPAPGPFPHRERSPVAVGALAGAQAAAAGLGVLLLPAVVVWLAAQGPTAALRSGSWTSATRTGAAAWLLGHGGALQVGDARVDVVPLGVTLLAVALCALSARRAAAALHAAPRRPPLASLTAAAASAVAAYTALATVAVALTTSPAVQVAVVPAVLGAAVVCSVGAVPALLGAEGLHRGLVAAPSTLALLALPRRLRLRLAQRRLLAPPSGRGAGPAVPAAVASALWSAAAAVLVLLGAGLLLTVAAVVARHDQVLSLHTAVPTGIIGGAALAVGQLLLLPVVALWGVALLAGPGFAVGAGTSVTTGAVSLGAVPALPLLGALPPAGDLPAGARALLLVPVVAGGVAGLVLRRRGPGRAPVLTGWRQQAGATAGAAAAAGAVVAVLTALASGSVGPGRMAQVGAEPLLVGLAVAAEVGLGAALVLLGPGVSRRASG